MYLLDLPSNIHVYAHMQLAEITARIPKTGAWRENPPCRPNEWRKNEEGVSEQTNQLTNNIILYLEAKFSFGICAVGKGDW